MRYTKSHEWVKQEGSLATVGITKFAQKELGEVVFVQLPKVGTHVKASGEACVLESTKAAVDVYSPVSGQVVAVNEALAGNPLLINQDPEGKGWLFRVALSHAEELTHLLTPAEYQKSVQLRS
jgi:glycine cleavage system H protein